MTEAEVMVPEKKMTRDEKRALEKVINGDFDILTAEFEDAIQKAETREKDRVKANFAEAANDATAFARELREVKENAQREIEEKLRQGRMRNIIPRNGYNNRIEIRIPTEFDNQAQTSALDKVSDKYREVRFKARNALQRRRLQALRTLALTGISSEAAKELLLDLPDAQDILNEATNPPETITLEIA